MAHSAGKLPKNLGLGVSLIPIGVLIACLCVNIVLFKDDASYGPNQIALLLAGASAAILGWLHRQPYSTIEDGILESMAMAQKAVLILTTVGALIAIWMLAGIVPTLIFYGLKLINPAVFLPVSCLVAAVIALGTGSSWSTTGTIGVALIVIGETLSIPSPMVAGAVISGAYFGDKMSPLSDTTNLAPAVAGSDIVAHIRHMMYTSGPAMVLALMGFAILGVVYGGGAADPEQIAAVLTSLEKTFVVSPWLLLVPVLVLVMVARGMAALPALLVGCGLGCGAALVWQGPLLRHLTGESSSVAALYQQFINIAYNGFKIESGHAYVDKLLNRGGISSMLNTIILALCAMVFGGAMEGTGMMQRLASAALRRVKSVGGLVTTTVLCCLFTNMTAADQYIAIIFPGRMFKETFAAFGLEAKNLSRALEDSGTVTSVLIPWNSGGVYNSGVLGVATLDYLVYCFFNILSPLISVFLGFTGWTITRRQSQ